METKEYSEAEAKAYILGCFREQGDFAEVADDAQLEKMVSAVMAHDAAFMKQTGADEGEVYDDDAAYDYMYEKMTAQFPDFKTYMLRLVEDYMDYSERYLDSLGLIDWE
ncbi:MAG: hypothetical protein GX417_04115 [Clostridiales bacterium]|nr:hypothetical protein [Clostridiales bacterium]